MNIKTSVIAVFMCLISINIIAQTNPFGYTCTLPQNAPALNQAVIGGQSKPESIDRYTLNPLATFPVLIVYVQFANDQGPNSSDWPVGQAPTYLGQVISQVKATNYGNSWWDAYNEVTAPLSDFWMEASRGHFHIVGQEVSIVLPHTYDYYITSPEYRGIEKVNDDIYAALQQNPNINWRNYDKWSKNGNTFIYGSGDGYVDMIYKVFRSHNPNLGMPAGGIAYLYPSYSQGDNYKIFDDHAGTQIFINGWFGDNGSGLTMTPGHGGAEGQSDYGRYQPLTQKGVTSFSEHEHGHYLFGSGHQRYGKMMGAGDEFGLDECLSPYESIRMGYMQTIPVNYNTPSNSIDDFSSRNNNSQGNVLEVPINGSNEFFLISNRQKVSNYDRIMWGDTAHDDPYRNLVNGNSPEYGKGVYIYHAAPGSSGYPWLIPIDQECADGLFTWQFNGYQHPDWSSEQNVEYYSRLSVDYTHNDPGNSSGLYHDGKGIGSWFSLGKKEVPPNNGGDGTDRINTNLIENPLYFYQYPYEVWTSREWKGDRWDAWKSGYNQVFSPYSSPSTRDYGNNNTGIFIYLESQHGTQADFKIYKAGQGGLTEDDILQLTPPSRPMNLKIDHCYQTQFNSYLRPKLTWNHNLEPDMRRNNHGTFFKRYNIYRVSSTAMNLLPDENNYSLLATVDVDENQTPSYVDNTVVSGCNEPPDAPCPPTCWSLYPIRYRVSAVDIYETESVKSDFASTTGWNTQAGGGIGSGNDNPSGNLTIIPKDFKLNQNYPNPFNPSTEIKYDLPSNTFVTIKIYNTLGEEVAELVSNEYKSAGRYSVTFDGTNLSSGIYFYSIKAGAFNDTKKMVLIK